ncbi:MAG: dihydrolipoyl dehydrogenase [Syntrophobacteraceae bacterium]
MPGPETFDLLVIGAGPGGYVAAVRAAELGMKTACVEKASEPGGVCLRIGCIPSKALLESTEYLDFARNRFAEHGIGAGNLSMDLAKLMERKNGIVSGLAGNVRRLLEENKVGLIHGTARLRSGSEVEVTGADGKVLLVRARSVLLATGSEPVLLPFLPLDGKNVISSTEALSLESVPGRLGIVGGGYIGLELGSVWARLGSKVTVIEMLHAIATALDGQAGRLLDRLLRRQGFDIRTRTRVVHSEAGEKEVTLTIEAGGKEERAVFDKVLVAVGRKPLTGGLGIEDLGVARDSRGFIVVDGKYRTSLAGVYAIGDLIPGPMLAHKASAEGIAAVEGMAGFEVEVDYDAIPSVVYTSPEVASVGKTEEELKGLGIEYRAGVYPFAGTARARCLGETDGFVKILAHARSDRILGVHILGPRASELIAECALAMRLHTTAEDLRRTVHAHPTLAEAVHESAMNLARRP